MRLLKEIRPLIGNYHVKSGVYHYYRNEYTQAVDFLQKALQDERTDEADRRRAKHYLTLSLMDSARRLESNGDLQGAVEDLRRAAQTSPDYPDIHFRLGGLLERQQEPTEAIREYEYAIDRNPSYLEAHIALGFCLLAHGRPERARKAFTRALELKRARIEAPYERGVGRLADGNVDEAAVCFHEAFRAIPQLCEEHVDKALAHLRDEAWEDALAELERALELNPKYPDLHNHRGIALCELNRLDEAIQAFRLSAELSAGFVVPRLNLAFTHIRAGEYREAEAELEAILSKDASEPAAKAALAELRSDRRPEPRRKVSRGSVR